MDFTFTTPEAFDGEYEEFIREMDAGETLPAGESQGVFGNMDDDPEEDALDAQMDRMNGRSEDRLTDVEADAMTLASCGWGTDEDYGMFDAGGEW